MISRTMSARGVDTISRMKVSATGLDRVADRSARRRWSGHPSDQRHDRGADQFLEHRFLVLEVQVDRPLGDPRPLGDVVKPGGGKAPRG